MPKSSSADISGLEAIMDTLREPGGCPWDREQTLDTLLPYIIEEAYEVVSAIEGGDPADIKDELGDLLFQVVFISRLAKEKGDFNLSDVINSSIEKMTRRHPHVFGEESAETSDEVIKHWAKIKKEEDKNKKTEEGTLSSIPRTMP
ncbi:MAG: MazG family protein, partial [Deltaproteobacteria bacterium]|nr:MazG family protein [Deltaproteobacteria bacterium]